MIRCTRVKRSVLQVIPIVHIRVLRFHLTSKICVRGASIKNFRNNESKGLNAVKTFRDPLPPQNTNINFLGIESNEGVITINPKTSFTQQNSVKEKLKEKFYSSSFGIIRYDSDNKLKFHGQHGNESDFVFPYSSNEYSEVSRNLTKVTSAIFDTTSNESEYSPKDINHLQSYSSNDVRKKENSDVQSPVKEDQDMSYIDEFYFRNISEKENDDKKNVDSSTEKLNFMDENYFGHFAASENPNFSNEWDSVRNTFTSEEVSSDYISKDCSEIKYIKNIADKNDKFNSTVNPDLLQNSNSLPFSKSSDDNMFEGTLCSQLNTAITFDTKHINSDKHLKSKEFDEKSNDFIQSIEHSQILESDSFSEENNSHVRQNTKIFTKSNKLSPCADSNSASKEYAKESVTTAFDFVTSLQKEHGIPKQNIKKDSFSEENNSQLKQNTKIFTKSNVLSPDTGSNSASKECVKESVTTAYDFVTGLHEEHGIPKQNIKKEHSPLDIKLDSKGFRILKNQVDDLSHYTRDEILNILKQNILYSDDDLLILNKPYSLIIHGSQTTRYPCLSAFLDELAKEMRQKTTDSKLLTVHRLDKETTGCLLLARNETMAQYLKSLFAQRKIIKKYWILTSKVPDPPEGVIDIPVAEGSVNNKQRMVLHPDIPKDIPYRNHSKRGKQAVTSYKVISESGNAALVEAIPQTGIKHQIRVHFGFGLCCPIIGDHKYSHFDKLAPQKLPSDILQRLHVRQSKVRYIPMHIHAKSVTIPGYFERQDLFVSAPLPDHMKVNLKRLRFKK